MDYPVVVVAFGDWLVFCVILQAPDLVCSYGNYYNGQSLRLIMPEQL